MNDGSSLGALSTGERCFSGLEFESSSVHIAYTYFLIHIIIIESSRGSFAQPSYSVQAQHMIYLLIGQELVFEHKYAVGMRHMR